MDWDTFEEWSNHIAKWGAQYHKTLRDRPVRAQTAPGEIAQQIPSAPPETGIEMDAIMQDFERIIMPGMTHWQHPRFFAYFPGNAAPPSILAEKIVSTMAIQSILWQTSPAASELEMKMIDWLRQAMGLPDGYQGVIQDTASSSTLCAVLTMRERAIHYSGNRDGLNAKGNLRVYCSDHVHSSIDRACWIAGIGQDNLVKIPSIGQRFAMNCTTLEAAIQADIAAGHTPAGIIAITGGTAIGACDQLGDVLAIAQKYDLYTHLDAAWAGAAMICPELQADFWAGVEGYDSIVVNPHKWLGAQFECSVQFLRDINPQLNTLKIEPDYLKSTQSGVRNFTELCPVLGRRFRALKLWFLIRAYGLEGLRGRIRNHILWARKVCDLIRGLDGFEIVTEPILSLFSFRCAGDDAMQQRLVDAINDDGRIYITQGTFEGRKIIRFQVGQFDTTQADVLSAAEVIKDVYNKISA